MTQADAKLPNCYDLCIGKFIVLQKQINSRQFVSAQPRRNRRERCGHHYSMISNNRTSPLCTSFQCKRYVGSCSAREVCEISPEYYVHGVECERRQQREPTAKYSLLNTQIEGNAPLFIRFGVKRDKTIMTNDNDRFEKRFRYFYKLCKRILKPLLYKCFSGSHTDTRFQHL
jgi:hypothetical protein